MPSTIDKLVEELVELKLANRRMYLRNKYIANLTGFPVTQINKNGTAEPIDPA